MLELSLLTCSHKQKKQVKPASSALTSEEDFSNYIYRYMNSSNPTIFFSHAIKIAA